MSLQKMISDIENERAHNGVLGETFQERLNDIKRRMAEEIDALADELRTEIAARDKALEQIITGERPNA
jgi:hypothetical protein